MGPGGASGSWSTETSLGALLGAAAALALTTGGVVEAAAGDGELTGAAPVGSTATEGALVEVVSAGGGAFDRVHQTARPEPASTARITLTIPTPSPLPERAGGATAGTATGAGARAGAAATGGVAAGAGGGVGVRTIAARYDGWLPSETRVAGSLAAGPLTTGVLTSGSDGARSRVVLARAPLCADSPGGAMGWSRSLYFPRPSAALTASSMAFCLRSLRVRAADSRYVTTSAVDALQLAAAIAASMARDKASAVGYRAAGSGISDLAMTSAIFGWTVSGSGAGGLPCVSAISTSRSLLEA